MEAKAEIVSENNQVVQLTPEICHPDEQNGTEQQRPHRSKSNSLASVDFETALTTSGCGKFNIFMLILLIPAAFTSGFVASSMSYVIPAATADLQLTPSGKASLQSAAYAGMISSGFFWGSLSDKLGRKKLLVIGFLLDFVMNFLVGVVPSLPFMLVFKYLSGFMVCGPFSIFTAYISEVFLSKRRDLAVLSLGIFTSIGNIVQAALAMWIIPGVVPFQIPLKSWQLFHISCGIPSLLCGIGCMFSVESPKFLMEKGHHEKALEVCRTIYTINTGNPPTSYPVKRLKHQISKSKDKKSFKENVSEAVAIFRPPFIQRAAFNFIIQFMVIASSNTLRLWLPEMLMLINASELDSEHGLCSLLSSGHASSTNSSSVKQDGQMEVYIKMMLVNAGALFTHLIFMAIVNYFGKKKMLISCSFLAVACALIIPLINADYVFLPASGFISLYKILLYCNLTIMVSVFPTRVRATIVSTTMLLGRTGILLVNFLIANLIYTYCEYFFYSLAGIAFGLFVLTFFVPVEPIDESSEDKIEKSSDSTNT